MRTLRPFAICAAGLFTLLAVLPAHAIENVKGKTYRLTEKHGPWMIMVASFRDIRDEDRRTEGLTAEQAAAELVFELREKGIPAYTFSQDGKVETIETRDRLGRDDTRIFAAQRDMICVLAGNYETIDDSVAQKTMAYVKRFHPKFLRNQKSGAVMRPNAEQKGPLAGAFMTINPMRDPQEVVQNHVDKETKYLNSGTEFALVSLKKKYTVQVATFTGKSTTPIGSSVYKGKESLFDKELQKPGFNIVRAGEDAEQLVRFLRQQKVDAYIYHDKFQSIVTVGGFDSPNDPHIRQVVQAYGPRLSPDPRSVSDAKPDKRELSQVLTPHCERLFAPGANEAKDQPLQVWVFDPELKVIPVPRIK